MEPAGLDFVFNGMGEEYFERGPAVLRRGGALVHYGGPQSLARFWLLVAKLFDLLAAGQIKPVIAARFPRPHGARPSPGTR
jgi:NADPH:quinone reductase-like Zn-dependent oxidoreductase